MWTGIDLDENHEFKGYWWLPSSPKARVPGTLRLISRDGVYLELQGRLSNKNRLSVVAKHEVIWGLTHTGQCVTIPDGIQTGLQVSAVGGTEAYSATRAFFGGHFLRDDQITFDAVFCWARHLDEWVDQSGFAFPDNKSPNHLVVSYTRPAEIILLDSSSTKISIDFLMHGPTHRMVQKSVEISQECCIKILRSKGKSIKHYLGDCSVVESFVTMGVGKGAYLRKIRGVMRGKRDGLIDVFLALDGQPAGRTILPPQMVFSYPKLAPSIRRMFQLWFRKRKQLLPLFNAYFSIVYGKDMYLDDKFLGITRLLEAYHRTFVGGQYESKEQFRASTYAAIVKAIPQDIETGYRESLKTRIGFLYEFSLRKRLEDLLSLAPKKLVSSILGDSTSEQEQFVGNVVVTRNYFTHYTQELEGKAFRGRKLFLAFVKLRILFEALLYRQMGLSRREIESLLLGNYRYQQEIGL